MPPYFYSIGVCRITFQGQRFSGEGNKYYGHRLLKIFKKSVYIYTKLIVKKNCLALTFSRLLVYPTNVLFVYELIQVILQNICTIRPYFLNSTSNTFSLNDSRLVIIN